MIQENTGESIKASFPLLYFLNRLDGSIMLDEGAYSAKLGGKTGIYPYKTKVERHLADLREYFLNRCLVEDMLSRGENPLIYVVYEIPRKAEGEFNVGCTILYLSLIHI